MHAEVMQKLMKTCFCCCQILKCFKMYEMCHKTYFWMHLKNNWTKNFKQKIDIVVWTWTVIFQFLWLYFLICDPYYIILTNIYNSCSFFNTNNENIVWGFSKCLYLIRYSRNLIEVIIQSASVKHLKGFRTQSSHARHQKPSINITITLENQNALF